MSAGGEANHRKGEDGAQRAKYWLDATTRTKSSWTNSDDFIAAQLAYEWPHATGTAKPFSFDLGGILFGEPFHNHPFVAEVKNYSTTGNIGGEFDDFLAKAYHVAQTAGLAQQFMFITWQPFRANDWSKQTKKDQVAKACLKNRSRLLGEADQQKAKKLLDQQVLDDLEERLWLVVLSEKQENLLISKEDRALINNKRTMDGLI